MKLSFKSVMEITLFIFFSECDKKKSDFLQNLNFSTDS